MGRRFPARSRGSLPIRTDPTGAVIGAAICKLTNEATGQTLNFIQTEGAHGAFRFTNVTPGTDNLTIGSVGFKAESIHSLSASASRLGRAAQWRPNKCAGFRRAMVSISAGVIPAFCNSSR